MRLWRSWFHSIFHCMQPMRMAQVLIGLVAGLYLALGGCGTSTSRPASDAAATTRTVGGSPGGNGGAATGGAGGVGGSSEARGGAGGSAPPGTGGNLQLGGSSGGVAASGGITTAGGVGSGGRTGSGGIRGSGGEPPPVGSCSDFNPPSNMSWYRCAATSVKCSIGEMSCCGQTAYRYTCVCLNYASASCSDNGPCPTCIDAGIDAYGSDGRAGSGG